MKVSILLAATMVLAACGGEKPREDASRADQPNLHAEFAAQSRAATDAMQLELKQALTAAMEDGDPVHALGVCSVQAPELAAQVSHDRGLQVRRVSERNRNPQNVPTPAQRAVLQYFASHPAADDTVIVEANEPTYLRAIRIGVDLCLRCHGDRASLSVELQAELARLYPQDRATGFARGDLRGAFVVRRGEAGGD